MDHLPDNDQRFPALAGEHLATPESKKELARDLNVLFPGWQDSH